MSRPTLFIDNHVHVYNRGVDKRVVFNNKADYARFIHTLYVCNDSEFTTKNLKRTITDVQHPTLHIYKNSGKRLVDILCFVLMPNHYHLLLKQNIEKGISLFMKRVGDAYTKYFNLKNHRTGSLFEGKYKYKIVVNEQQLVYLSKYIHLNPIKILEPNWKEKGISNQKQANDFLENYKWSSYMDYIDIKNFPSVINPGLLIGYYKNPKEYKIFLNDYLVEDFDRIKDLF